MNLHEYWFGNIEVTSEYYERQIKRWFWRNNEKLDQDCREIFAPLLDREFLIPDNTTDYLSLILLLDQGPRNAFRNSSRAYEYDHFAQKLAVAALGTKFESELSLPERIFLYMPLEHAEDLALQDLAVEKFFELHRLAPPGIRSWTQLGVDKAIEHRKIIRNFGYFPSREIFASALPNSPSGRGL